ncbi:hypothetical protein YM304_08890 [Ilumatobacter coccineus YM16-304]|uniref:Uncharacterized protein n=1 Tax=Ilumatobacter coccineus (strain NBRC 103263 / KCTC 29153 / YM16-304) TaxID=1313172 RepID=A0A6C7E3F2_ILUCY|nr:hypothetical protein YM304_08890 [Ilumatobacter coccineus YM16-304]
MPIKGHEQSEQEPDCWPWRSTGPAQSKPLGRDRCGGGRVARRRRPGTRQRGRPAGLDGQPHRAVSIDRHSSKSVGRTAHDADRTWGDHRLRGLRRQRQLLHPLDRDRHRREHRGDRRDRAVVHHDVSGRCCEPSDDLAAEPEPRSGRERQQHRCDAVDQW